MAITLNKGQGISLLKANNDNKLSHITMGLGWDAFILKPVKSGGILGFGAKETGQMEKVPCDVDLDASCVSLDSQGNVLNVVYYPRANHYNQNRSIQHSGDNTTGEGDGDDEQIRVSLDDLPDNVEHLVFTVSTFTYGVDFNIVDKAYCRILGNNEKELINYPLDSSGSHTAIIMGKVSRNGGDWTFDTIGELCQGRTVNDLQENIKACMKL
ncbi:TerD family protein [Pseudoalteromonas sp. OFAV1]|jgi:tellurium resistance protein TerZ|uniref:TerD family protein n=1 Tax=Pseudoalteromonas sp. OFAV1 TaxID=2908892 RepID=UPI001F1582AE|nr:TerD family protein [Pseudoalteromonas sp. OFAV1]MCF2903193.1 TerD family protein [Pseudoalteromonas sp. OFAV1]